MTPVTIMLHGRRFTERPIAPGGEGDKRLACRDCALVSAPPSVCLQADAALRLALRDRRRVSCATRGTVWVED